VRTAVAILVAGAVLAGCGSSSNQPVPQGGPHINASLELADCNDWNQASIEDRLGTIHQLKNFAGGPVTGGGANPSSGTGAVLTDQQAYDLMNNYCKNSFARGFKLYKLYERAASFRGQPQQ
jgi:hypothetical protein